MSKEDRRCSGRGVTQFNFKKSHDKVLSQRINGKEATFHCHSYKE